MENNFKIFHQLDGSSYKVPADTCRGCWMNENPNKLPKEISPIWQDEDIIIRQDIEWPIPAFFIVSLRKHISSIADLPPEVSAKLFKMITLVRKGMKDVLGIKRVQLYHEEKINNPHIHFWLLPLWPDIMEINNIFPKIYEGNVKQYIDLFKFTDTKDEIIKNNKLMKEYLEKF